MAYNPENVPFSKPTISIDCLYQVDLKKELLVNQKQIFINMDVVL